MKFVNFPNGFRPRESDFLLREENKAAEFARLRQAFGRGIVSGLQLTRQTDGAITLSSGHGNDGAGHLIIAPQTQTLNLQTITLPNTNKLRYVAVILNYQQLEQGQAEGQWAEKLDSYTIDYRLGNEASSEAAAQRPRTSGAGLRVGDILYDDNGTRSADAIAAEYLSSANNALGLDLNFQTELGPDYHNYQGSQKLRAFLQGLPKILGKLKQWASGDATTKANNAKNQAINTAASDATNKANNAQSQAINAAASDATNKANNAQSQAINAAARDATGKANTAEIKAISTAANDATTKANNARMDEVTLWTGIEHTNALISLSQPGSLFRLLVIEGNHRGFLNGGFAIVMTHQGFISGQFSGVESPAEPRKSVTSAGRHHNDSTIQIYTPGPQLRVIRVTGYR